MKNTMTTKTPMKNKRGKMVLLAPIFLLIAWFCFFVVDYCSVVFNGKPPIFCVGDTTDSHYVGIGYSYDVYPHPITGKVEYQLSVLGSSIESTFTNQL